MTKADRLREARNDAGFKFASEAARALGVKEPTYAGHENGSRDFDDDSAALYGRRFGVRPEWLIYGTGPKKGPVPFEPVIIPIEDAERNGRGGYSGAASGVHDVLGSMPGMIPEIDASAGAGDGTVGETIVIASGGIASGHAVVQEWAVPVEMQRYWLGATPGRLVVLPVEGDSMEPTLSAGDRVLVDLDSRAPKDGAIYVLDEGFGPIVKRARYLAGTDPLEIEIISDNPRLSPIRRPADSIRIVGRVRGRWSRM